jgi:hypothetical protein
MKWMRESTKRQCGRAPAAPRRRPRSSTPRFPSIRRAARSRGPLPIVGRGRVSLLTNLDTWHSKTVHTSFLVSRPRRGLSPGLVRAQSPLANEPVSHPAQARWRGLSGRAAPAGARRLRRRGRPGVRSHCRFRNRGTEYVSEYGIKWISGGAKRQCDRALGRPGRRGARPPAPRPPPPDRAARRAIRGGAVCCARDEERRGYRAFGLIGTALSKKISIFQASSLKVVPISPNASYLQPHGHPPPPSGARRPGRCQRLWCRARPPRRRYKGEPRRSAAARGSAQVVIEAPERAHRCGPRVSAGRRAPPANGGRAPVKTL